MMSSTVFAPGKKLAVPGQELGRIRLGAGQLLLEELIEVADHGPVRRQVLRAHAPDGIGHARRIAVEDRASQPFDQGLKALPGRGLQEVVVLQRTDPVAEVVGQRIEPVEPLGDRPAEEVGQLWRRGRGFVR